MIYYRKSCEAMIDYIMDAEMGGTFDPDSKSLLTFYGLLTILEKIYAGENIPMTDYYQSLHNQAHTAVDKEPTISERRKYFG